MTRYAGTLSSKQCRDGISSSLGEERAGSMEHNIGASHHLVKGPLLQQVCFVEGQLPWQRLAQDAQMGYFVLVLQAPDRASDVPSFFEKLLNKLGGNITVIQPPTHGRSAQDRAFYTSRCTQQQ